MESIVRFNGLDSLQSTTNVSWSWDLGPGNTFVCSKFRFERKSLLWCQQLALGFVSEVCSNHLHRPSPQTAIRGFPKKPLAGGGPVVGEAEGSTERNETLSTPPPGRGRDGRALQAVDERRIRLDSLPSLPYDQKPAFEQRVYGPHET